jgi:gluconolactonase
MSVRRRLAFALVTLPVAFYAYACSSDPEGGETPEGDDGGETSETGPGIDGSVPGKDGSVPGQDGSTTKDGSTPVDGGGDAADAAPPTCIGNPLTADGGTADGGSNVDAATPVTIVTIGNDTFLDGPQWVEADGGGVLVYSEFDQTERVLRVAADGGAPALFRDAAAAPLLGNALAPTGNAFRNGFVVTLASDKAGGTNSRLLQTAADGGIGPTIVLGTEGLSPNDLAIGKAGHIYFTDPRYQANGAPPTGIFATNADASVATRVATFNAGEKPNGIALSPDGTKLYVAFTEPKRVDSYVVPANGIIAAGAAATTVITTAKLTDAPDGITVDVGGNIYVAEAEALGGNNGRVQVFKPNGDLWGEIPLPNTRPTGVAFGGVDKKTLFITFETAGAGGSGIRTYVGRCAGLP